MKAIILDIDEALSEDGAMNTKKKNRKCTVSGCGERHQAIGFCKMHYQRNLRGIPLEAPKSDKRGERNPKWRGGIIGDGHGRILVYSPNHPRPSMFGTHVYRYRLVMEKHLGRHLRKGEVIHHVNGIKDDDRIKNLRVMSQSQHATIDTPFGLKGRWAMSGASRCVNCGTNKIRHEGKNLCLSCYPKRSK